MKRALPRSLAEVAVTVGDALRRHGVTAVLTGGACASLHSGGKPESEDVDFVLGENVRRESLEAAMTEIGFKRSGDHYVRRGSPFWVEFPRGPLAIGADHVLKPVTIRRKRAATLALSATDSCRDRLSAFYHWSDHQALAVAVDIALANRLAYATIRRWSEGEGMLPRYEEFLTAVRAAKRVKRG